MPRTKVHEVTSDAEVSAPVSNGALTLEDILNTDDLPTKTVDVPEWNGHVKVKAITGRQRDTIISQFMTGSGGMDFTRFPDFRLMLISYSLVKANGERIANPENIQQIMDSLGEKSSAALERVWNDCLTLAGMGAGQPDRILEDLKTDPSETPG